jgi:hypothetical protein
MPDTSSRTSAKTILTFINKNLEYIIFSLLLLVLIILLSRRSWEGFFNEEKGINKLDAIIYINLENRGDRKDLLMKELESLDTNMKRVHKVSGIYIPKNGHKGCIQSHILALNMIKLNRNKWNRVLILEDDAELTIKPEQVNEVISKALEKLDEIDPDWKVLMLATAWKVISKDNNPDIQGLEISNPEGKEVPLALERIHRATTASAYIVKESYVDDILNLFNRCNMKMKHTELSGDNYEPWALDQKWETLQAKDHWYCLDKDIIKQRAIWSTTMSESHK